MGTVIGRPERIAVEFDLWPPTPENRRWLFGTICLWAAGQRIGWHDEQCAMTVARVEFPHILRNAGKRRDPSLMAMPAAQAFETIHRALYDNADDLSDREIDELSERYVRFEALPRGFDAFDGWLGFLIEDRVAARLIWRDPDDMIGEARCGAGEFDRVIEGFLTELERQSGGVPPSPQR